MKHTIAQLSTQNENDWFVWFRIENPETQKMDLIKIRDGINRIKNLKERRKHAKALEISTNNKLKEGWSPFEQLEVNPLKDLKTLNLFEEFFKIKSPELRERSISSYRHTLNLFKEFLTKNNRSYIRIEQFKSSDALAFSDWMITEKKHSGKTHNNNITRIRVFFNMAVGRELIGLNPFRVVKKKIVIKTKLETYSKQEIKEIKKYLEANNHPMYMFIQFIYYCFIRPKELMMLKVKHIDFVNGNIFIPAQISKNKKDSIIPIRKDFFKLVLEKYKGVDSEYYLFGTKLEPSPKSIHRNRATESHKAMLQSVGVDKKELYDWKHTGASDYIIAGHNPVSLKQLMRHHSLDETMGYLESLNVMVGGKINPKAWQF